MIADSDLKGKLADLIKKVSPALNIKHVKKELEDLINHITINEVEEE